MSAYSIRCGWRTRTYRSQQDEAGVTQLLVNLQELLGCGAGGHLILRAQLLTQGLHFTEQFLWAGSKLSPRPGRYLGASYTGEGVGSPKRSNGPHSLKYVTHSHKGVARLTGNRHDPIHSGPMQRMQPPWLVPEYGLPYMPSGDTPQPQALGLTW